MPGEPRNLGALIARPAAEAKGLGRHTSSAARPGRDQKARDEMSPPPLVHAPPASPWWDEDRHRDRRPRLAERARIKAAIRAWFEAQGFVEVEPACLQVSPGNETHLHAFATDLVGTDLGRRRMYLHTSPEFAMKKLVAAGESRIFAFAPVFRNRERGPLHAPEFTMLEWYRAGEPYTVLLDDCAALARIAAEVTGRGTWRWRGRSCEVAAAAERTTVDGAFRRLAGIALRDTIGDDGHVDRAALAARAAAAGVAIAADDGWSDMVSKVLTERVEPHLGAPRLEMLTEYPLHEAALARPLAADPALAERFEMYCCGVELANGFGELTDPVSQRTNLERQMAERERIHGDRHPIDDDFIAALAHMPPTSGCAMGFDRLVMLATGACRVDEVQWTPISD